MKITLRTHDERKAAMIANIRRTFPTITQDVAEALYDKYRGMAALNLMTAFNAGKKLYFACKKVMQTS